MQSCWQSLQRRLSGRGGPSSPELQPIRRWRECNRVHLDGAPTTMPTPLFLRASGKIITLRQKRPAMIDLNKRAIAASAVAKVVHAIS
jgi:hypothetical protein